MAYFEMDHEEQTSVKFESLFKKLYLKMSTKWQVILLNLNGLNKRKIVIVNVRILPFSTRPEGHLLLIVVFGVLVQHLR